MKTPRHTDELDSNTSNEPLPIYEPVGPAEFLTAPSVPSRALHLERPAFERKGQIISSNDDGRIDLHDGEGLSELLRYFTGGTASEKPQSQEPVAPWTAANPTPKMNVLMFVVGSRGDVQPFIALGEALKSDGHRVRVATHPHFQTFVETHGLEFFDIGGDPAELMAYMVQNPGLVPRFNAFRQGEIQRRRRSMRDVMHASWRACFEPGDLPGEDFFKTPNDKPAKAHAKQRDPRPFIADAIIANPPSLAHIHCAERLGVPLHILFTMPWLPTQDFPHPLANVKTSNNKIGQVNYLSYLLVESVIWQGLGSIINRFRHKVLELDPIHPSRAPAILQSLRIPHTFCWSTSLLPKPADWHSSVAVSGYLFHHSRESYSPSVTLRSFLEGGPPPVYIGFGSIVVDDPSSLTNTIIEAVQRSGNRAIVSAGWSSLGQSSPTSPHIFVLNEDCPHDWLFPQVSSVVHHGGAGTTAAGLNAGRPTVIVPFFGDQFFWGDIIYRAGAGPRPIPYRSLSAVALAEAIEAALQPDVLACAARLGVCIKNENGIEGALQNIYAHLPTESMTCALVPSRVAVWKSLSTGIQLSGVAATVLRKEKLIDWSDLALHRPIEHNVSRGPFEPVSGAVWAVTELLYDSFRGMGEILTEFGHAPVLGHRLWTRMRSSLEDKSVEDLEVDEDGVSNYRVAMTDKVAVEYPMSEKAEMHIKDHKFLGEYMLTGTARICKAAVRAPGTFTAAMAQGAHNMPHIWGDSKVRTPAKVTGIGSGVTEGCKELVLGVYDGVSGLVTQPVSGLMEEGPTGFLKGAGKGVLGLPVKFFAAASGIVGYPLKGIDVAVSHAFKSDGMKAVRNQRMLQGEHEYAEIFEQTRKEIIGRWRDIMAKDDIQLVRQ